MIQEQNILEVIASCDIKIGNYSENCARLMRELKENTQLSPFTHLNIVVNRNESRQTATTRIRVIYPFKFSIDKGTNSSEDMLAVARSHADDIADVIGNVEAKLQMAFIIVNKQTQAVFDVNFSKQYFAQADKAQLLNTTIFAYVSEYELICEIVDADVTIQPLPPYPPIPVKPTQHNTLMGLDYEHAGHTGFQRELIPDESITIDEEGHIHANGESYTAGQNISIDENNVISAVDTKYTQGTGITIDQNNVVSNDVSPLVPAQATINNQLADKDFVNSSIATSTATFRGTYNVVTDLHLSTSATHQQVATALGNTISVADNNDYCFVEIPTDDLTPTEILQVDRYKYNGSLWSFEYTLNNSGYTSAQWKAINSGITSGKVTQYDDYATSKQDTLIAGTNITIGADGKTISSDIPQATSSVYGKVLLGAAGGAATYESVGDGKPICYPTTASEVKTTSMVVKSSVSDNGKILTENGFVYNTSGNPTVSDTKVVCDLGAGFFEKKLENLTQNTEYHIKSYGQNSSGLVYGSELVQRTSFIPDEYQQVEYLQSSGIQYINTLVNVDRALKWEYDYMFLGSGQDQNGGSLSSSERFLIANLNHLYIGMGNGIETSINVLNDRHKFTLDPTYNRYGVDDNFYSLASTLTAINYSIYLFARNSQGNISNWSVGRCYNSKFYFGGELIRDMYPVYRIADSKPGMYDIVNNVFYTNQGTSEFIVGPDKQWE